MNISESDYDATYTIKLGYAAEDNDDAEIYAEAVKNLLESIEAEVYIKSGRRGDQVGLFQVLTWQVVRSRDKTIVRGEGF